MTTVRYYGPSTGAALLARELEQAGLTVSFTPPLETRSVEGELARVVIPVVDQGVDGIVGDIALAIASKVVTAFKARNPGTIEIEVQSDGPRHLMSFFSGPLAPSWRLTYEHPDFVLDYYESGDFEKTEARQTVMQAPLSLTVDWLAEQLVGTELGAEAGAELARRFAASWPELFEGGIARAP
ncbi:MAG TPA: hypothetical protein VEH29_13460 [Acidimicrobiales bacterium]|nr:hypothetical protein [Acidimicrobiales bacterium]